MTSGGTIALSVLVTIVCTACAASEPGADGNATTARRLDSLRASIDALVRPAFPYDGPGGVVLVARDDVPVYEQAFGLANVERRVAMRTDHAFKVASISKEFTAMAVLHLVAAGRLALDDDVRTYVPEFDTRGRRITIEQVLTHTAGIPNLVDVAGFDSIARDDHTVDALLALTRGLPLHFEPGTRFRYSDTGYILLGAIIERLTGRTYGRFVTEQMFAPLGMRRSFDGTGAIPDGILADGYTIRDGDVAPASHISMTVPHAAGALVSTARDLLQWHAALRAGAVAPRALLERAWQTRRLADGTLVGYGFGFQLCSLAGRRTIEHGGFINGFLAAALQLPDDNLDVIVLTNNDAGQPDAGALARRIARFVVGAPSIAQLSPEHRAALVGSYRMASGVVSSVHDVDGELRVQRGDGPAVRLVPVSPTMLTRPETEEGWSLEFGLGDDGRAATLRIAVRCEPVDAGRRQ